MSRLELHLSLSLALGGISASAAQAVATHTDTGAIRWAKRLLQYSSFGAWLRHAGSAEAQLQSLWRATEHVAGERPECCRSRHEAPSGGRGVQVPGRTTDTVVLPPVLRAPQAWTL